MILPEFKIRNVKPNKRERKEKPFDKHSEDYCIMLPSAPEGGMMKLCCKNYYKFGCITTVSVADRFCHSNNTAMEIEVFV